VPPVILRGVGLPDYLTTEEVAAALGYHPDYVRTMLRVGKLKADKKAGVWLVYRESVQQFKKANEGKAKHDPRRGA